MRKKKLKFISDIFFKHVITKKKYIELIHFLFISVCPMSQLYCYLFHLLLIHLFSKNSRHIINILLAIGVYNLIVCILILLLLIIFIFKIKFIHFTKS